MEYMGNVSKTVTGVTCQHRSAQFPHVYQQTTMIDGTLELAENKSRNPDRSQSLWCYTINPDDRWNLCDVPICTGM